MLDPRDRSPALCVFCSASQEIDPRYLALATQVGAAIAERGWQVVSGAGSISMMGALAIAARAGGGRTIGVIPDALLEREVGDTDSDELVVTRDMRQRKGIMDERSDAFLALPGGLGTLEELAEVWSARSLNLHYKPVVILDPWGDFAPLRAQVEHWVERGFVQQMALEHVHWAAGTQEALSVIEQAWRAGGAPGDRGIDRPDPVPGGIRDGIPR